MVLAKTHNEKYDPIRKSTYGLVFFGTPHAGGNKAGNNLLGTLTKGSLYNETTSDDFSVQLNNFEIIRYYEMRKTDVKVVVDRTLSGDPKEGSYDLIIGHMTEIATKAKDWAAQRRQQDVRPLEVPFEQNRHFVGDQSHFHELDTIYASKAKVAIMSGMGGVGKTQTAVEYCHLRKQRSDGDIFWINAQSNSSVTSSWTEIMSTISPDDSKDPVKAAKRRLAEVPYNLLVFDNVDGYDAALELLSYARNGDVIITTRDSALAGSARFPHGIHLSALARSQSMLLFVLNCHGWTAQQTKQIREDFDCLAERPDQGLPATIAATFAEKFHIRFLSQLDNIGALTGDLPLAIVQCASYLREFPMTYGHYLKKFESLYAENRRRFYGTKVKDGQYDKSIMTTWNITFGKLEAVMPSACRLLTLLGFLDRVTTFEDFLENALSELNFWAD
ncbi:MAG: hypothetical protein Q9211_000992 [Gyalolechia sp. 1 TL-2023]